MNYLSVRPLVLSNTLSHIWDRLNVPMLLFKEGLVEFTNVMMKSTVVDESLSSFKPMYCSREYQASTRLIQQYEKSTLNYTPRIWDRGQALT